ncbi:MAG: hypothetical protein HY292_05790 [Planctomycetes bacterium]|nr:hypothetical protein [Planctomycetota bacterium]
MTPFVVVLAACGVASADDSAADANTYRTLVRDAQGKVSENKSAEAAAMLERAVALNPCDADTWYQLAIARYGAQDFRGAIPAFEKAMTLGANFPFNSAYNVACCEARLGERDKAFEWLQKALDLGFRDLEAARADADFESLRTDPRFRDLLLTADVSKMSRDEGWRYDLALLVREMKRLHFSPYRRTSEKGFAAAVAKLRDDLPKLSDNAIKVAFMKLLAMAGDGHTHLTVGDPHGETHDAVPVQFDEFTEGLYIVAADPKRASLAGTRVVKVGDRPIDEVLKSLDPVISRDNDLWPHFIAPRLLRRPWILNGLGLVSDATHFTLTVANAKGETQTVTLEGNAGDPAADWVSARRDATAPTPLYLRDTKKPYRFEVLPDSKIVYVQWNAVADDPVEPFAAFCKRLQETVQSKDVERLVLDLRFNSGGNNFLNRPMIECLVRCEKIDQQGRLFVITGRNTFSAAMCAAGQIERYTNAIFVGEPTGSSPNFIGESVPIVFPFSKLRATVSDLYWQNSVAMDHRTWIAPMLYTPPSFAAFVANRDPAMEAILAYRD